MFYFVVDVERGWGVDAIDEPRNQNRLAEPAKIVQTTAKHAFVDLESDLFAGLAFGRVPRRRVRGVNSAAWKRDVAGPSISRVAGALDEEQRKVVIALAQDQRDGSLNLDRVVAEFGLVAFEATGKFVEGSRHAAASRRWLRPGSTHEVGSDMVCGLFVMAPRGRVHLQRVLSIGR